MSAAYEAVTDDVVRHLFDTRAGLGAEMTNSRLDDMIGSAGGLGGIALARLRMAQLGAGDPALGQACARAIEACDVWETLLVELLGDVGADAAIGVAAQVLAARLPNHPLARLAGPFAVICAFDLTGRGTRLRLPSLSAPSSLLPAAWRDAILVGVDRPERDVARVVTLSDDGEWLSVEIDGLHDWLEPHRVICPGCLLIIA